MEKMTKLSKKKIVLLCCSIAAVLLVGAALFYAYFISPVKPFIILENVSVQGIDVGGMTKAQAAQALEALNSSYQQTPVTITVLDETHTLTFAQTGATLDTKAAAKAAYACGRTGTRDNRQQDLLQAAESGIQVDIASCISFNDTTLSPSLDEISKHHTKPVVHSAYQLTGQRPSLSYDCADSGDQQLHITLGTSGVELSTDVLYQAVENAYYTNELTADVTCTIIEPQGVDLDAIYNEHCVAPVDAVMDMQTFEVTPHTDGYRFDLENAKQTIAGGREGQEFTFDFQRYSPENTYESLKSLLYRDVLGEYTAYAGSIPGRNINLKLSCQAINGYVLMPNEIFSYNPTLGERTPEAGWQKADGYVGSETISTYGGGICQASSCLYLSAMLADLEIVERINHGFISSYMPYGMDATVSWGGPEFRFKNTTDYPIRIEAYASGGAVTVKLLGTDTKDYYVKMSYDVLQVIPYKTVEKELEANNPDGYKDGDTITSPYTGYKIRTYRCKYSKADDSLISKEVEATSSYSSRDKVICRIKPEAPVETAPPETTAQTDPSAPSDTTTPAETGT